ncbi:hypothetical protein, partial [Pseudomonas aeruginosa]|uniref:hypothetical protein n=1 Tax=Pseudomonas aeruginosa TaxID=287 RepID=UPI001179902E
EEKKKDRNDNETEGICSGEYLHEADGKGNEEGSRGFEDVNKRLVLVRTGERRHHLIYTNHHILMDGWSNCELLQPSIRMW